jgi:hypothetical protein
VGSAASWPSRERRSRERAREERTARPRDARERAGTARSAVLGVCVSVCGRCGTVRRYRRMSDVWSTRHRDVLQCDDECTRVKGTNYSTALDNNHTWTGGEPLSESRDRGSPHLYSVCLVLSCVLLWHSSNVEHVVAPDQHLAQLARKVAVDPLLGAGQLRAGAGRRTEVSAARASRSSSRAHLHEGSPAGSCTRRRRLGSPCTPCPI